MTYEQRRSLLVQWAVTGLVIAGLTALLVPKAHGQPIPWTLEERVKKTEDRVEKLEWRLDRLEGKKAATAPEAPRTKRVQVNGLWYDQHEDGRMVECEECNVGKVVSWRSGAVYVHPSTAATPNAVARPVHGAINPAFYNMQPVQGVTAYTPFTGPAGYSTTLTISATGVGPFSTSYQAPTAGATHTRATGVGRPGIISRLFRGGCTTGG